MLATVMLFGWPLIALALFAKLEFRKAIILSVMLGFLLLPAHFGYDFPILPRIDKNFIAGFAAILGVIVFAKKADPARVLRGWVPRSKLILLLLAMLFGGAILTALTNGERLVYGAGARTQPGLTFYDGFTNAVAYGVVLLPFFVARRYLADADSHRLIIFVLVGAALFYSLPTLWEVRMSPQLQKQIYGFHGGQWRQNVRASGFRPYVFLNHGLPLGVFFMMAILAALGAGRFAKEMRPRFLLAGLWLFGTLLLSKNLGSTFIATTLGLGLLFLPVRGQMLLASTIALLFMSYPLLRNADMVPTERMVEWARLVNDDRAGSLKFRFMNEEILLDRALEKPFAGWGGWGRHRVIDERGQDISVTDGGWVITLGEGGFIRYIGLFGLITLPILIMTIRRYEIEQTTATLVLIATGSLINVLPNSHISPIAWLAIGAIAGRFELGRQATAAAPAPATTSHVPGRARGSGPVLTRQTTRHVRVQSTGSLQ
jgi:hypothetical protein